MFNLKDFDHLRTDPTVQFKEETISEIDVVTICYMISNDELWKKPLGRECRGHSFRKDTGELISMAFNKFFNISEKEETQIHNVNWVDEFEVMSKADGSMISFALIDGEVYAKTKKSFYSDVAILANKLMPENVYKFVKFSLSNNISPVFEFTHPEWKIVIDYGEEPTWKLLAMRDMDTGAYFYRNFLVQQSNDFKIELIDYHDFKSYSEIKDYVDNLTNAEGYVIHFPSTGFRMKTKCNWYNDRHHINTDLRERDVAKYSVEETLDDIKTTIIELGYDMSKVSTIEARVVYDMIYIKMGIESLANKIKTYPSRKDAALVLAKTKFFGEAIKSIEGREIDFKKIWYRDYLKDYALKTVYSDFNHTNETPEETEPSHKINLLLEEA